MTEPGTGALGVEAVVQRFTEAEHLLAEAGSRVRAIAEAAETAASGSASLNGAAAAIRDLAEQEKTAVAALREVLDISAQSLQAATDFLANTDVSRLTQTVADLATRVESLQEALATERAEHDELGRRTLATLDAVAEKVDHSQQLLRERDAAVTKAERILAAVPPRIRKRLDASLG
jgi:hypothetical protein